MFSDMFEVLCSTPRGVFYRVRILTVVFLLNNLRVKWMNWYIWSPKSPNRRYVGFPKSQIHSFCKLGSVSSAYGYLLNWSVKFIRIVFPIKQHKRRTLWLNWNYITDLTISLFKYNPWQFYISFTNYSFCFCLCRISGDLLTFHSLIVRFVFVFAIFFVFILHFSRQNFVLFLFVAYFPWQFYILVAKTFFLFFFQRSFNVLFINFSFLLYFFVNVLLLLLR